MATKTTKFLRFRDLKERGIVSSWTQLIRLINLHGFPVGRYFGVNSRVWTEDEVNAWISSRPTSRQDFAEDYTTA